MEKERMTSNSQYHPKTTDNSADSPDSCQECVYQDIQGIYWLLELLPNEKDKAISQKILHRGLDLFRRILLIHGGSEEGHQLLQHAEACLFHLDRLADQSDSRAREDLLSQIAHSRKELKPLHELIQQQEQNHSKMGYSATEHGKHTKSASFSRSESHVPSQKASNEQEYTGNSVKPSCKTEFAKNLSSLLYFPVYHHSYHVSLSVDFNTIAPETVHFK